MRLIALDPEQVVEIELPGYSRLPKEDRPVILAKYLTAREKVRVARLVDQAGELSKKDDTEGMFAKMQEIFSIGLRGWKNIDGTFDPSALLDMFTTQEAWDVVYATLLTTRLTENERKNSESPSSSAMPATNTTADANIVTVAGTVA